MNRSLNANNERFYVVTVQGKTMLFSYARIDRITVPQNVYVYEVKYNDCIKGEPNQIAIYINKNFLGTLLSQYPIEFKHSEEVGVPCYNIDPKREWFFEGFMLTLQKYLEKYPQETVCH